MMKISEDEAIAAALLDLAERIDVDEVEIEVSEVRTMIWQDTSLGCPQPGMMYAQVIQKGLLICLSVDEELYFYHSKDGEEPFLCENSPFASPHTTPTIDDLIPPGNGNTY